MTLFVWLRGRTVHASMQRVQRGASLMVLLSGISACSSPNLDSPSVVDPTQSPWTLSLSTHAITMSTAAPYNTLQLTAMTRTVTGAPLAGAPAPVFTSSDSSVRVSATGMLTARAAQSGVQIIATVVSQGIRVSDTALVNVVDDPHPHSVRSLQVMVAPGDSAKMPAFGAALYWIHYDPTFSFGTKTVIVQAVDSVGTQIPGSQVEVWTSDTSQLKANALADKVITSFNTLALSSNQTLSHAGSITVYAAATVYGVTLRDSLRIQMTDPLFFIYTLKRLSSEEGAPPVFSLIPQGQPIAVGGYVWWNNSDSTGVNDSLDIVFDDPTAASPDLAFLNTGGGNIAPFLGKNFVTDMPNAVRSRRFLRAGTFRFHSARTGVSGEVVVR